MNTSEKALGLGYLDSLETHQLAMLNSLYSSAAVTIDEYTWRWQHAPRPAVDHWIRLQCGDRKLWLGIAAASIDEAIEFCWRDFDGDAQRIAWCASHESILQLAQRVFQSDWVPSEIGTDVHDAEGMIEAGFKIYCADRCVAIGRCCFDPAAAPTQATEDTPSHVLRGVPVAIPIVVDRAVFTVSELRELEVGAVVRVQRRAFLDIGATLRLRFGGNDLLVRVTGTMLTVVRIESAGAVRATNMEREMGQSEDQVQMSDNHADSNEESWNAPIDVANLPVEVRFEAGRILTRYDEFCRIKPGYTYELGHTLGEQTIEITANGALIARGELVSIGDQLGVRITALACDPRAAG